MSISSKIPVMSWSGSEDCSAVDHIEDNIAGEVPVALTFNRMSHVVMMASPADLEDFGLGFSVTEGLISAQDDLLDLKIVPRQGGVEIAMTISETWFERLAAQRRNMVGRTGCGLCGAENIEQALRTPSAVGHGLKVNHESLQRVVSELEKHQPLQAETGAAHGAAWCSPQGEILHLSEDIGRHNALDKLIGRLLRTGCDLDSGFVLVSSRASYEMVYKTAAVGIQMIMAVSAPTTLAVEFAQKCGVTLVGFARPGRHNVYSFSERITDGRDGDE